MANKYITKYSSIISTVIIVIVAALLLFFVYRILSEPKDNTQTKSTDLIDQNVYKEVTKPIDYGQSVSIDEEGFGRANPFSPYK